MEHQFIGQWISDEEFYALEPRNVFHRQLEKVTLDTNEHRDKHVLFRRTFALEQKPASAALFLTADDYYKVYINGTFVTMGPTPGYPQHTYYHTVDVTPYLKAGKNVLAVHTLYQGLINRVWVSGDRRHGLLLDLIADGETILASDETFLTRQHSGYRELGTVGYTTQFLEHYDSTAPETNFFEESFDDSGWAHAKRVLHNDHVLFPASTSPVVTETVLPRTIEKRGSVLFIDFGATYVGYLNVTAEGAGEVTVQCGQELNPDGTVRWQMRCNCAYSETWLLSGKESKLDWFDYKSFRYAQLILPEGVRVTDVSLTARHYPFALRAERKPETYEKDLSRVWALCVNSQRYGVQEVIQDCMDREKGFYVGDGCYTALTHMVLSGDDAIVRKLIDDARVATFITPGLVTCLDCSFMQEIAEYPLMLISLMLWHYLLKGDNAYLKENFAFAKSLLENYRENYEQDGLLNNLDKWCVVEWPENFQDGYDADVREGKVCTDIHIAINAYYLEAIHVVNRMAALTGEPMYRDDAPLYKAFLNAFYDEKRHIFVDRPGSDHASLIGNVFAYGFGLYPNAQTAENIEKMIGERGIHEVSMFGLLPLLAGLTKRNKQEMVLACLRDPGAWLRNLREGATTTYEGWGRDTKWNTSLFHLTISCGAIFLTEGTAEKLFAPVTES